MIPDCPAPQRGDRSAGGGLPTRAFRYCDPVTTASAFGWYVFPPIGFSLMFDGAEVIWTYDGAEHWFPLSRSAQFPHFAAHFDESAPEDVRGFSPPFLSAFLEPGLVQIWSGWIARTAPGYSLLIRPVPNLSQSIGYQLFDGMVETDHWFGPLFTNLRITRSDVPIDFKPGLPMFHVQPVLRSLYEGRALDDIGVVDSLADWTEAEWDDFRATVVAPNQIKHRPPGRHAVSLRKRRKEERRTEPEPQEA